MKFDDTLFQSFGTKKFFKEETQVVIVSDMFADQCLGGAELTLQALMDTSPFAYERLNSSQVTMDHIRDGESKFWIFGNYSQLNPNLISQIASNLRYSIVECDYKFCKFRSIEKHIIEEQKECDCDTKNIGNLIASFMSAAEHIWWMSEKQQKIYLDRFPFLIDYKQNVLSSVFDDRFFKKLEELRKANITKNSKYLILDHPSWIKNTKQAVDVAREFGIDYELVGQVTHDVMLEKLASSEGFLFLPSGGDTCPRIVIEAKLLGCKLILNENVQHLHESWFDTDDLSAIEDYLRASPAIFWKGISQHITRQYSISGYTTTFNCVKQMYPFEECVRSMLAFCEEVVIVDGGSTDGTLDVLRNLSAEDGRVKVHVIERDWSSPQSALYDGQQKAEARKLCTSDFVWQMDVDELVRIEDCQKIRAITKNFPKSVPMIALPVVEYWGGVDKIRMDVTPWKWRMSRNSPRITHGIPNHLRSKDSEGNLISLPGSDGCDPVDVNNGEPIVFLGFMTNQTDAVRNAALNGDTNAQKQYSEWFENVVANVPSVYHLSWLDIVRKIKLYSTTTGTFGWSSHWEKLNGKKYVDCAENNMFFDKPWSEVTEQDIQDKAKELYENTGGHIFHSKYRGHRTPWITFANVTVPSEVLKASTVTGK